MYKYLLTFESIYVNKYISIFIYNTTNYNLFIHENTILMIMIKKKVKKKKKYIHIDLK